MPIFFSYSLNNLVSEKIGITAIMSYQKDMFSDLLENRDTSRSFILKINSAVQDVNLSEIYLITCLQNYFFQNNHPLILISRGLQNGLAEEKLKDYYNKQGEYLEIIYEDETINYKEHQSLEKLLISDSFIIIDESNLIAINNELNQNPIYLSYLELYKQLDEAKIKLKWKEEQVSNHKQYLQVLKNTIQNKSADWPQGKLIRLLKRNALIRKYGKKFYRYIFTE